MPQMGWLARQDGYDPDAFDVPLEQSTGVGWANRLGDILTTRPPDNPAVAYKTPYFDITEGDIGRATEAALGGMTVTPKGIKAYHSSPHDFDKFDLSKIGSGEGAQVYGHGLYFAESPAVSGRGGQYWQQFLNHPAIPEGQQHAGSRLRAEGFDREKAIAATERDVKDWREGALGNDERAKRMLALREAELAALLENKAGPRTYEVNINADPAHMLDWDKPLREQPKSAEQFADLIYRNPKPTGPYPTGKDLYAAIARKQVNADWGAPGALAESLASRQLLEAGIPGIKYLDQGSRGKSSGSSNFVIFDPGIIDIMKKYGIAGATAVPVMGSLASEGNYQTEEKY